MVSIIIGVVLCSLFVTVTMLVLSDLNDKYAITGYDNSSFETYNRLQEMNNLSMEIRDSSDISLDADYIDIIGGYIKSGYNVMKISTKSYSTIYAIQDDAIDQTNMGAAGTYFKSAFATIILVIIFLGILIAAILGR